MPSKPTLIIHGATAYTAHHLLLYLESHPQTDDFEIILAGRNLKKLEDVNSTLKVPRELFQVDTKDEDEVRELVKKGDVVLNLAGPFRWYGAEAIIAECAANGKHYVDLSGEAAWLATDIIPKYDYLASKTGACIVPSCGFDSVPSDMTLYHALRTLQDTHPDASITKSTAMFKAQGGMSGGTINTMRSVAGLKPSQRKDGEWCLTPLQIQKPSTPMKLLYPFNLPSQSTKYAGIFLMYPYNRTVVRRSWYLSQREPSTLSIRLPSAIEREEPRHGGELVYQECMDFGGRITAIIAGVLMGVFAALFFGSRIVSPISSSRLREQTRKLLDLVLPSGGSGPPRETLEKGFFRIESVSETTIPGLQVVTRCKGSGDPGYLNTCYTLAESALSLVLPPPKGTELPPLASQGGVLTPSTAMGGVLIERLRMSGKVEWSSELVQV